MDEILTQIAKEHLDLDTLKTSCSDADFKEQAVWCIYDALEAAYKAGQKAGA